METPKVDVMGRANETHTRTGCPFPTIDRGVSDSLAPRVSVNYEMTIMPLDDKIAMFVYKSEISPHEGVKGGLSIKREATGETTLDPGGVEDHSALFRRVRPRGLLDPSWVTDARESIRFEAEEGSPDPYGPRKLSATLLQGGP
ncbi:hypothetical protein CRG98_024685 [Punica granatum]|uniref:Uncharacterized protein n=1 Tax=Punica granatum TaxID=22663 RepID=A0A2I0JH27_PUNGR|nr:hypothetical protein CRG98_024685 [Punica granatum]